MPSTQKNNNNNNSNHIEVLEAPDSNGRVLSNPSSGSEFRSFPTSPQQVEIQHHDDHDDERTPPQPTATTTLDHQHRQNNNNDEHHLPHHHTYHTTPLRYLVLAEYCLLAFMNGAQWIIFANIVDEAVDFYGITKFELDWLTTCFYIAFIVTAFWAIAFFDKFGVRYSLIVASSAQFLGGLMKLITALWFKNYPFLLISQAITGASQSFFLPVPSALSCTWFGEEERTLATMIGSVFNPLGAAVSIYAQTLFVNETHKDSKAFAMLFGLLTALNGLDLFLIVFVIPNRPKHAPTEAGHIRHVLQERHANVPIGERLKRLWNESAPHVKNFGTLALLIGSGMCIGCYWTLTTLISQIAQPFGISQRLVGYMGLFNVFFGLPVGCFVAHYIDKARIYKKPLVITIILVIVGSVLFTLLLKFIPESAEYHLAAIFIILGGPQNLIITISFEAAAETTFPLNENLVCTLVLMGAEISTLVFMNALPPLLQSTSMTPENSSLLSCLVLIGMNVFGLVLVSCSTIEMNRKKQSEHNDLGIEDSDDDDDDANNGENASLIRNAAR